MIKNTFSTAKSESQLRPYRIHVLFQLPTQWSCLSNYLERSSHYPLKLVSEFTLRPLILGWFNFHACTIKTVRNTSFHRFNRFISDFIATSAVFLCEHNRTYLVPAIPAQDAHPASAPGQVIGRSAPTVCMQIGECADWSPAACLDVLGQQWHDHSCSPRPGYILCITDFLGFFNSLVC
jgi:hypothetical protein